MANGNDFFQKMCKEALDEMASGSHGTWRDMPSNILFLACFGMLFNHLYHRMIRPLQIVAGCAVTASLGYIISLIMSKMA